MEEWIFTIACRPLTARCRASNSLLGSNLKIGILLRCHKYVTFVVDDMWQAPIHPHIYSNGHICASILGNDWSPVLNAVSICITMQSMLASNKSKVRPEGDQRYVRNAPANPKLTSWKYDDDVCTNEILNRVLTIIIQTV
ncbi:hypothetical protein CNBE4240 [Cryptococcus deneoformans B-3501A]|uniref:hypothetical protein n=1 Tax=Cryptococcus deneoformans (strain B-3501A) TaxID=283643 RepID=UPI000042EC25|nr:hypothetical protein CNBE4240 [Cryptococcus neoformans var. neoformans B-3501A]EAL20504.1 hypothetical protein CNBE4240 [Cryptococcus neoformans var. neoformans B-3501A]